MVVACLALEFGELPRGLVDDRIADRTLFDPFKDLIYILLP